MDSPFEVISGIRVLLFTATAEHAKAEKQKRQIEKVMVISRFPEIFAASN